MPEPSQRCHQLRQNCLRVDNDYADIYAKSEIYFAIFFACQKGVQVEFFYREEKGQKLMTLFH